MIGILDVIQDYRVLSPLEVQLKRDLKIRFLGMTAIEKLRARQRSRLVSIRAAEANEKLFYMQANGRRRKNTFSPCLLIQGWPFHMRIRLKLFFRILAHTLAGRRRGMLLYSGKIWGCRGRSSGPLTLGRHVY
jgi:hypothetical protein